LAAINYGIGAFLSNYKDDKVTGYNWLLVGLAGMDVLAIILAQVLIYVDNSRGKQLCTTGNQKKEDPSAGSINSPDSVYGVIDNKSNS
jgi:hypothetical protein